MNISSILQRAIITVLCPTGHRKRRVFQGLEVLETRTFLDVEQHFLMWDPQPNNTDLFDQNNWSDLNHGYGAPTVAINNTQADRFALEFDGWTGSVTVNQDNKTVDSLSLSNSSVVTMNMNGKTMGRNKGTGTFGKE